MARLARFTRAVAGVLLAGALTTMTLAACDIRVETAPQPTPTADAAQAARDAAARYEAAIIAALGAQTATGSGREALDGLESVAAPVHLDVLGGVYEPFPQATPSPETAPQPGDLHGAVLAARDNALDQAFTDSTSDAGFLAGSMALTHAFAVWHAGVVDAQRAGVEIEPIAYRPLPGAFGLATPDIPAGTAVAGDALADLAVRHDQARFAYEAMAAREAGARRTTALERAERHRDASDRFAQLVTGMDPRTPVYELPNASIVDEAARDATARSLEQTLGWRYMELTSGASAEDRLWLMNAAFDAYAGSALMPGFTLAEFPVLPGVDPDSY